MYCIKYHRCTLHLSGESPAGIFFIVIKGNTNVWLFLWSALIKYIKVTKLCAAFCYG